MTNAALQAIREIATKTTPSHYLVRLHFKREFTRGTLLGLTHDDSIPFCSAADADEWVSDVNRNNKRGTVDYKVISWRIEKI